MSAGGSIYSGSDFQPSVQPGLEYILCSWSDCARPGRKSRQLVVPNESRKVGDIMLFCTDEHRQYWAAEVERR